MVCPRCQTDNPPQARFCRECGVRLGLQCAECGAELPDSAKFCVQCGRQAGAAADAGSRAGAPDAAPPRRLAEKIVASRASLEGERKQVTVLFADLKGSLELLADRDPEDARRLLDAVLERMMDAVHHYEGTVNQVLGDGIMALFGAPLAHEDHAVRACYSALRMQQSVKQYAQGIRRTEGFPVQIRVGLNSGEVVVRSIDSDLHMDYTAVGQTTHLAARMEQMAMPGSILVTANTLRLAEGYVLVQPVGPLTIKGLAEPVEAYEVTGAGAARTRLEAAAGRGLSRFVGRQVELETLRKAAERVRAGHGQVVALGGEPGVGKSRLALEFSRSYRTHAWRTLGGTAVPYGKATPYLPVLDLLRSYFQIEARDDGRKTREKVTGKLLALDRSLEPALSPVLSLLDALTEDAAWESLEPPQRRLRTLEAVKRLLLRESQVQPLLVIVEDLHWMDAESQAVLDTLVESIPTARLLLLVNYRGGYEHAWSSKSYYTQVRVDALAGESAHELLRFLLGEDPPLAPLKESLIERTQGNPFFLEECIRTLVETQVLAGERGAYRVARALPPALVPATIQPVLAARIDRLPPEDKQLLQAAAVVGKDVPFALVQKVVELPEQALRAGLGRLQAAEFLYETSLYPDLEYTFKHALTHEVAYGSLLQERRRALHAKILDALEALPPSRLGEHIERLAHHAFAGEVWDRAVGYLRASGAKAAARSAHREAVTCFERALVALGHLAESRDTLVQRLELRLDLRRALLPLGESERILQHLRDAEAVAVSLGDDHRAGRITAYLANHFWWVGDPMRAIEAGERALATAAGLGDVTLEATASYYLGQTHCALGSYARALEFLRRAVDAVGSEQNDQGQRRSRPAVVLFLGWSVRCLSERGEFADAAALSGDVTRMAEEIDQPASRIAADQARAFLHLRRGEFALAIGAVERHRALRSVVNLPPQFILSDSLLGYACALGGRVPEAIPLLEQAMAEAAAIAHMVDQALRAAWLAEAYLLAGRAEDAVQFARRALDLSREHKERAHEAYALRLLGEIAARGEAPDAAAEGWYQGAIELADELGMHPLLAQCRRGLELLGLKEGRTGKAVG